MSQTVKINNTIITILEYQQQRLLTIYDLMSLHNMSYAMIRITFDDNIEDFIRETDYFKLFSTEVKGNYINLYELEKGALLGHVFTETGYLKLAKLLADDFEWEIQQEVIKSYFHE